jgi:hypothetical protein
MYAYINKVDTINLEWCEHHFIFQSKCCGNLSWPAWQLLWFLAVMFSWLTNQMTLEPLACQKCRVACDYLGVIHDTLVQVRGDINQDPEDVRTSPPMHLIALPVGILGCQISVQRPAAAPIARNCPSWHNILFDISGFGSSGKWHCIGYRDADTTCQQPS